MADKKAKAALPLAHQTTDNYTDYYTGQSQCKLALDGLFNSGTVKGIKIKTVTDLPTSAHYALHAMFDGFVTARNGCLVLRIPGTEDLGDGGGSAKALLKLKWNGPQLRHITFEPSTADLTRTRGIFRKKLETLEIDNKTALRSRPDPDASVVVTTTAVTLAEIQAPVAADLTAAGATQTGSLVTIDAKKDSDKKWVRVKLADGKLGYVPLSASRIPCARFSRVATANESKGKVDVTNASALVKGSSDVGWTATAAGRRLRIEGHSVEYMVQSVDVAKRELTLTAPYLGTTAPSQAYTLFAVEPVAEKGKEKLENKIAKNFAKNSRTLTEHVLIYGVDAALDLLMAGKIECFANAGEQIGSIEGDKRVEIVAVDSAGQQPLDYKRIEPRGATGRPFSPLFLLYNLFKSENNTHVDMLTTRPATISAAKPDHPLLHLLKTSGGTTDANLILDLGRDYPPAPLRLTRPIERGAIEVGQGLDIGPLAGWHKTLNSRLSAYLAAGKGNAATSWRTYGAEAADTQEDQTGVMKVVVEPGRAGDVPSWLTHDANTRIASCYDSEPTGIDGGQRYKTFWDKYASFINACATLFQLPCELILAISTVEAGGSPEENNTRTEPLKFEAIEGTVKFNETDDVKDIDFAVEASTLPQTALSGAGAIASSVYIRPIQLTLKTQISDKSNLKVALIKPDGTPNGTTVLTTTLSAMTEGTVTHQLPITDVSLSGTGYWKWRLTYKKKDATVKYKLYRRHVSFDFPGQDAATRQNISIYEHLLGKKLGNNVQIDQVWDPTAPVRNLGGTAVDQRTTGYFTWGDLVSLGNTAYAFTVAGETKSARIANFSWSLMQTTLKPAYDMLTWAREIYGASLFDAWSFPVTHGTHSATLKVAAFPTVEQNFFQEWAACSVSGSGDDVYFTKLLRVLHSYILGAIFLKKNSSRTDYDPPTAAATYNGGGGLFERTAESTLLWRNVWAMVTFNAHYPITLPAQYNAAVRRFRTAETTNPPGFVKPILTIWK